MLENDDYLTHIIIALTISLLFIMAMLFSREKERPEIKIVGQEKKIQEDSYFKDN